MIAYGFHHVLEGADHLLFLLALLLPAPLLARNGRWHPGRPTGDSCLAVVAIASAFAVGHSLTLMAAALNWVNPPAGPVEVLVALSVAVAAVHAIRPLVARGELIIAGGFGLIHGLAFAGLLADADQNQGVSIASLLAFNVGVEVAQLVTIGLTFPALVLLSRTRWYPHIRVTMAVFAMVAAGLWAAERVGMFPNPLGVVEDAAITHKWVLVAGLGAVGLCGALGESLARRRTTRQRAHTFVSDALTTPHTSPASTQKCPDSTEGKPGQFESF